MDKLIRNSTAEFLIFTSQSGENSIEVKVFDESVWLTQAMIAELFDVQRPAITKHLKNIFESYELDENSVSSILEHTANDGKTYNTKYYNLDAFLEFDDREILHDAGKITKKIADEKALSEFEKYRVVQDRLFMSDFDRLILDVKKEEPNK
jgi:hypothetical protein